VNDRTKYRLRDIANAIDDIDALLSGKSFSDVQADRFLRAAFERFLEIISEASRHVPDMLTNEADQIPWSRIKAIGNHIRHAYDRVDAEILWNTYAQGELAKLREVVIAFIATLEIDDKK
jgi:uncharacterized protein with HEPN domain